MNTIPSQALVKKAKRRRLIYSILAVFQLLVVLRALQTLVKKSTDPVTDFIAFFIILSIFLFFSYKAYRWHQTIQLCKLYPDYAHLLKLSEDNSLNYLSTQLSASPETVKKNLQAMEDLGLFPSMVIAQDGTIHVDSQDLLNLAQKLKGTITVICPHCGAQAALYQGQAKPCEYCGGILKPEA